MLRRLMMAGMLTAGLAVPAAAETMGPSSPYGSAVFPYSPTASPFESFAWTPLDFAAFAAYGGDFANIRKPVAPVSFFLDPGPAAPGAPGPDDEQEMMFARALAPAAFLEESEAYSVAEPGILALAGAALVGLSARLRRRYAGQ